MKKKIIALALAIIITIGIFGVTALAADVNPTASTVSVNGKIISFEAYNIGGNNFFKLRDLAYVLNKTEKQFEVGYDNDTKAITLTSGKKYTPTGNQEMIPGDGKAKAATPTPSRIYLDGKELNFTVYNIGGNNFFKLRDLMEVLDVFVGYDDDTKAITLDTSKGYVLEGTTPTQPSSDISPGMPQGNTGIVGVWLGMYWDYSSGQSPRYVVFYDDGTFMFKLPKNGFIGFDKVQDKNNNKDRNIWGTYTFSSGSGTWKYDNEGVANTGTITLENDGGLDLGTTLYSKFYRCASVDDYGLNGSYSSYGSSSELDNRFKPGDARPVINFKTDGTFVDEGLFTIHMSLNNPIGAENPGSGTYVLKDFTLILRYSDGRTKQMGFSFSYGSSNRDASGYVIILDSFLLHKIS